MASAALPSSPPASAMLALASSGTNSELTMIQPFCNMIEQRVIDGFLHMTVQTKRTIDTVDDVPGYMTDNSVYRHMVIDLDTGEFVDNYLGPHGL